MRVILANPRGFCAGVNMAIEVVDQVLNLKGPPVYVFHEIVHNRHVVEDTAVFLDRVVTAGGDLGAAARDAVRAEIEAGRRIPGLGHPVHKTEDPRTERIYAIAQEQGLVGPHLEALRLVAGAHREATGRALPINGAGVAGAALADLGFPTRIVRGMALLARTAGLVAHLEEEQSHPLGMPLFLDVERRAGGD